MMGIVSQNMPNKFKSVVLFLQILVTLVLSRGHKWFSKVFKFHSNLILSKAKVQKIPGHYQKIFNRCNTQY